MGATAFSGGRLRSSELFDVTIQLFANGATGLSVFTEQAIDDPGILLAWGGAISLAAGQKGLLFVALSYRWLARGEPDPDGFHLGIVASGLDKLLDPKHPDTGRTHLFCSYLAIAFEYAGLGEADCAVFWDSAR